MNRKLGIAAVLVGAVAAAAIALTSGANTFAAFTDYADIDANLVGAGFLQVDLAVSGPRNASLDLENQAPGDTGRESIWVNNDSRSANSGNVSLSFRNLTDTAAPCDTSPGKATGEIASGVGGCIVSGDTMTGTPAQGNLSRVLSVQVASYPGIGNPAGCAHLQSSAPHDTILAPAPGNLRASASANNGAGTGYQLTTADGTTPLLLAPGAGICIGVAAYWPPDNNRPERPNPDYPSDNATQGDSLTADVRFDLTQAG